MTNNSCDFHLNLQVTWLVVSRKFLRQLYDRHVPQPLARELIDQQTREISRSSETLSEVLAECGV